MIKGFTLIELLVVVLIIGILAAVSVPLYEKVVWKARAAEAVALGRELIREVDAYYLANGRGPSSLGEIYDTPQGWSKQEIDIHDDDVEGDDAAPVIGTQTSFSKKYIRADCSSPSKESGCFMVALYLEHPQWGDMVTLWWWRSDIEMMGKRWCLADKFVKMADLSKSICVGLGGKEIEKESTESPFRLYSW